ncbi:MAG: MBL fold metallo-hydrolase [Anaerolineales bacterium]|nr:MBL fold metallo-hydrolase [Anaerolineales bacterium]
MEITWYGLSCFRITERGKISIVTDPYDPAIGLPKRTLKADVVTISYDTPGHNFFKAVKVGRRVIDGPGEFEIGGVFITGVRRVSKVDKKNGEMQNTLFVLSFDGLTVAHLGNMATVPTQAQIEELGSVNIALVPVGGGGALNPSMAAEVISLIEPSIVIPMHYKTGEKDSELSTVEGFLKEMGVSDQAPLPSLNITKSSLTEETQVVVLTPAS